MHIAQCTDNKCSYRCKLKNAMLLVCTYDLDPVKVRGYGCLVTTVDRERTRIPTFAKSRSQVNELIVLENSKRERAVPLASNMERGRGRGRGGGRGGPGDWTCPSPRCRFVNFQRNAVCFRCKALRPVKKGERLKDLREVGLTWSCCMVGWGWGGE